MDSIYNQINHLVDGVVSSFFFPSSANKNKKKNKKRESLTTLHNHNNNNNNNNNNNIHNHIINKKKESILKIDQLRKLIQQYPVLYSRAVKCFIHQMQSVDEDKYHNYITKRNNSDSNSIITRDELMIQFLSSLFICCYCNKKVKKKNIEDDRISFPPYDRQYISSSVIRDRKYIEQQLTQIYSQITLESCRLWMVDCWTTCSQYDGLLVQRSEDQSEFIKFETTESAIIYKLSLVIWSSGVISEKKADDSSTVVQAQRTTCSKSVSSQSYLHKHIDRQIESIFKHLVTRKDFSNDEMLDLISNSSSRDNFVPLVDQLSHVIAQHSKPIEWNHFLKRSDEQLSHSNLVIPCHVEQLRSFLEQLLLSFMTYHCSGDDLNRHLQLATIFWDCIRSFSRCCSKEESIVHFIARFPFSISILLFMNCKTISDSLEHTVAIQVIKQFCTESGKSLLIQEMAIRALQKLYSQSNTIMLSLLSSSADQLMKYICRNNGYGYVYRVGDPGFHIIERFLFLLQVLPTGDTRSKLSSFDLMNHILQKYEIHLVLNWASVLHHHTLNNKFSYGDYVHSIISTKMYDGMSILKAIQDRLTSEHVVHVQAVLIPLLSSISKNDSLDQSIKSYADTIRKEAVDKFPSLPSSLLRKQSAEQFSSQVSLGSIFDLYMKHGPSDIFLSKIVQTYKDASHILTELKELKDVYMAQWIGNIQLMGTAMQMMNYLKMVLSGEQTNLLLDQLRKGFSSSFFFQSPKELEQVLDTSRHSINHRDGNTVLNLQEGNISEFSEVLIDQRIHQLLCSSNSLVDTNALANLLMKYIFLQEMDAEDSTQMNASAHSLLQCCIRIFRVYRNFFLPDGLIATYSNLLLKMSTVECFDSAQSGGIMNQWRLFAPTQLMLAYSENCNNNIICTQLRWDKIFNEDMCARIWCNNVLFFVVQFIMGQHLPDFSSIWKQTPSHLTIESRIPSGNIWSVQALIHRMDWLYDWYRYKTSIGETNTDQCNFLNWWDSVRKKLRPEVVLPYPPSPSSSSIHLSGMKPNHISINTSNRDMWFQEEQPLYYDHLKNTVNNYSKYFSKPGYCRWLLWTLNACSNATTITVSATKATNSSPSHPVHCHKEWIRDSIYNLYLPHYFHNSYGRLLSFTLIALTKFLKSSKILTIDGLPLSLTNVIAECCDIASVAHNGSEHEQQQQQFYSIKDEKLESVSSNSISSTISPSSSEAQWFLHLLMHFPSDNSQLLEQHFLTVLDLIFLQHNHHSSLLPALPNKFDSAWGLSKFTTQMCISVKTILLNKPFLLHHNLTRILFQWSYGANCELMVTTVCDIAKKVHKVEMSAFIATTCELMNPCIGQWIQGIVKLKYGISLTPNPTKTQGSNQKHCDDLPVTNGHEDDTCIPESNKIWQSWKMFQERTRNASERKRQRNASEMIICLSPPRRKKKKFS